MPSIARSISSDISLMAVIHLFGWSLNYDLGLKSLLALSFSWIPTCTSWQSMETHNVAALAHVYKHRFYEVRRAVGYKIRHVTIGDL